MSNLPTAVFGISATNVQFSGTCQRATCVVQEVASSAGLAVIPGRSTTQASGRSPQRSSGMPITAASCTAGCAISWFSRSTEEIHSPPDLITSLIRSVMVKKPRSSIVPTSPVRSQPSRNFSGAGSLWYEPVTHGPRTSISPSLAPSHGSSSPSLPMIRISTPCMTRPARIRQSRSSGVPSGDLRRAAAPGRPPG